MVSNFDDTSKMPKSSMDIFDCSDWDKQTPTLTAIVRLKRDTANLFKDPIPGIFIAPEPDDITKFHALIIGPSNTPYQGGFFYFILRCPPDYPIRAPRCMLMTTGNKTVRFHPYFDRNGKIFLSILNTWDGPSWNPIQTISSVFLSIQSILSQNPYYDEPDFEQKRQLDDSNRYNEIILHETLRVAVCEMLENSDSCPQVLREIMINQFFEYYDYYVSVCTENMDNDDQLMRDPFGDQRGSYQYSSIFTRLDQLKTRFQITKPSNGDQLLITPYIENVVEYYNQPSNKLPHVYPDMDDIETNKSESEYKKTEEDNDDDK